MKTVRILLIGLVLSPVLLLAQKREDFLQIQRDVAQLQEQVKQLQKSQDDRMTALQGMLQQAVDASAKLSSGLTAFEQDITRKLNDQKESQSKLADPVAALSTKVGDMADNLQAMANNVDALVKKMSTLDTRLSDMDSAIRTLSTPPAQPPPQPQSASAAPAGPPPGESSETSYQRAYRDYMGGNSQLAMDEFDRYLKDFPNTENAPAAQFYIAQLYYNAKMYDDAAQAYSDVLERYPENPKTQEALYYKAVCLVKLERKTEAGKEFRDFINRYPKSEHVTQAHVNLRALGLDRTPARKR